MFDDVDAYSADFYVRLREKETREPFRLLEQRLQEALDRIQLLEREVARLKTGLGGILW